MQCVFRSNSYRIVKYWQFERIASWKNSSQPSLGQLSIAVRFMLGLELVRVRVRFRVRVRVRVKVR